MDADHVEWCLKRRSCRLNGAVNMATESRWKDRNKGEVDAGGRIVEANKYVSTVKCVGGLFVRDGGKSDEWLG